MVMRWLIERDLSNPTLIDFASAVAAWASNHLRLVSENDSEALDAWQIRSGFSFWLLANGGNLCGAAALDTLLPKALTELGAKTTEWTSGDESYSWWNVAPINWLAGHRRLSENARKVLGEPGHRIMPSRQLVMTHFGEAVSFLLWEFSTVTSEGGPPEHLGLLDCPTVLKNAEIFDNPGDTWVWKPRNLNDCYAEGTLTLSLYDADITTLR